MDGWVAGWMDGWLDGWMDGWIDGWLYRCINRHTVTLKESCIQTRYVTDNSKAVMAIRNPR